MTQVLTKKNYTAHVPANDEEVDGLDFGSGAVTPAPHIYCEARQSVIGKSSALVTKKNWTLPKSSPSTSLLQLGTDSEIAAMEKLGFVFLLTNYRLSRCLT